MESANGYHILNVPFEVYWGVVLKHLSCGMLAENSVGIGPCSLLQAKLSREVGWQVLVCPEEEEP